MAARFGVRIWTRRLLVMAWMAVGLTSGHAAEQVPYERVSRLSYEQRGAELDLARLFAERGRVTGATARALEAKINFRILVHYLYTRAVEQEDVAMRSLIAARADVLKSGLDGLDELVGQIGLWEHDLAGLPASSNDASVAEKRRTAEARLQGVSLLAQIAGRDLPTELADPKALDKLMGPVVRSIVLMAAPGRVDSSKLDLPPAWPERNLPDPHKGGAPAQPDFDLDGLASAIERSGLSSALRAQMLDGLRIVGEALADPKQRADALTLGRLIEANLDAARVIAKAKLITGPVKAKLTGRMSTGLLLVADSRTRPLGVKRLELAAQLGSVVARLDKAKLADGTRSQISDALRATIRYLDDPLYEDRGSRLLVGLDKLAEHVVRLYRSYDDVRVAKPFDQPFDRIRRLWLASIDAGIAALAKENTQAAANHCKTMARHAGDLDLVLALPDAITQMRQIPKVRTMVLRRRLVDASEALAGQGDGRKAAVEFLRSVLQAQKQISRFYALAYDRRLYAEMDKVVGGRMKALRRSGELNVNRLVAGLSGVPKKPDASGKPVRSPTKSAKTHNPRAALTQLIDLLSAVHTLACLGRRDREVRQLERWRAWPLRTKPVRTMIEPLSSSVVAAARQANDTSADLSGALQPVRRYVPLAQVLVAMAERYGGWLGHAPEGVLGLAARLYQDPRRPMGSVERAVMQMCLEINEAGYAQRIDLADYAGRHLVQARNLLDVAVGSKR